jgi:hypothetical protein
MTTYSRDQLREIIPLFFNGSLAEEDADILMAAIAEDEALQQAFDDFAELNSAYERMPMPDEAQFDSLFQRVDTRVASRQSAGGRQSIESIWSLMKSFFAQPLLPWGLAVAQFAVIAIVVIQQPQTSPPPVYQTLSNEQSGMRLNIIFNDTVDVAAMNRFLQQHDLQIVAGPSATRVFVVSARDAVDEQTMQTIRASSLIQFAEKTM